MKIVKTHVYMEPFDFDDGDGHGFRTVVELETGNCALISEIHRPRLRLDEVLVFKCDAAGNVTNWSDIYSATSTQDAFTSSSEWRLDES